MPPRPAHHVFRRTLIATILGIITTLLSAWGLALYPFETCCIYSQFPVGASTHQVKVLQEPSSTVEWWYMLPLPDNYPVDYFTLVDEPPWRVTTTTLNTTANWLLLKVPLGNDVQLPPWLPRTIDREHPLIAYGGRAVGWPFFSMRSVLLCESPGAPIEPHWSFRVRDAVGPGPTRNNRQDPADGTVPLQPIPAGFAANTALFAACWYVLTMAPSDFRRWRRARAHLCPACGYARAGLPPHANCPECGRTTNDES